jgi:hypothetical protein
MIGYLASFQCVCAWNISAPIDSLPQSELKLDRLFSLPKRFGKSSMDRRNTAQAERFLDRRAAIEQRQAAQSLLQSAGVIDLAGVGAPSRWPERRIAGLPARPPQLSAAAGPLPRKEAPEVAAPEPLAHRHHRGVEEGNSVLQLE